MDGCLLLLIFTFVCFFEELLVLFERMLFHRDRAVVPRLPGDLEGFQNVDLLRVERSKLACLVWPSWASALANGQQPHKGAF